ncbi:unnamed protein product [Moneuplotes crassus]|uniref:Uncharacterized protein n=1 Tax=Euplotes crassus TaxID=5936 RepID=A0AAD1ULY4_EUPCR|nr:unnamed protein product [Moneuplotes crassus]
MGSGASNKRNLNDKYKSRRQKSHNGIQVLQFYSKPEFTNLPDGILWRTKKEKTFLPGQLGDYTMLKEYGIIKIFLKKEKAEKIEEEIYRVIEEKEDEKREIEDEMEAGSSIDRKKKGEISNIQKIISDYQRVLKCIQDRNNNQSDEENKSYHSSVSEDEKKEMDDCVNNPTPIQKDKIKDWIRKHDTGMADAYRDNGRLRLILTNPKHVKILDEILDNLDKNLDNPEGYILPDLNTLEIKLVANIVDKADKLLRNHFPIKVKHLWVRNNHSEHDITRYWNILDSIDSQRMNQLVLSKFYIPADILGNIFNHFYQVRILAFWYCKLEAEEVEISDEIEFEIEHIVFKNCRQGTKRNRYLDYLWRFIEAIGRSNLKDSLQSCRFKNDKKVKIKPQEIQKIFYCNGMTDVKVIEAIYEGLELDYQKF